MVAIVNFDEVEQIGLQIKTENPILCSKNDSIWVSETASLNLGIFYLLDGSE